MTRLSLRTRLAASIAAVVAVSLGVTYLAVYRGTGAELRERIDAGLATEVQRLARAAREGRAAGYVASRSFAATAQLLVVQAPGRAAITNEPDLLDIDEEDDDDPEERADDPEERADDPEERADDPEERAEEAAEVRPLRSAPEGYATVEVDDDVGPVRLLSRDVTEDGRVVATVRAGEPLAAVERAQAGVGRAFLLAGSVTLVAALAAGWLVAARTAAPLRRMARTAGVVREGRLSERMRASGPRDEVRALADAFDLMLDRLEDAFARQRSFVADASHELRTPLTVVRGQLEVLARQPEVTPEDVARVERTASAEVQRMERLVDDLLALARTEEEVTGRREEVDLLPFLTELFDGVTLTAARRFELGPLPEGRLACDPDRVAQAVRNLTRNAVEHTKEGGLVRLEAARRDGDLEVAVLDDGPGIPPAERARVFDRFHRTDAARTRGAGGRGGAGLGLAIARAAVEAHGGRIWAGEACGGGARIAFTLPGFTARSGTQAASR